MITIRHYHPNGTTPDVAVANLADLESRIGVAGVNWINIELGPADRALVEAVMTLFDLDDQFRTAVDEIVSAAGTPNSALPKFDAIRTDALFRLNMLSLSGTGDADPAFGERDIGREHLCFVGVGNTLISFQQGNIVGDIFDPVRGLIEKNRYQIREHGIDHLFHAMLDAILAEYFRIVAVLRERIDDMEEQTQTGNTDERELMRDIVRVKQVIRFLRRETVHLKWAFDDIRNHENRFATDDATRIHAETIRDRLQELLTYYEYGNDNLTDLINISISLSGMRMSRIMKTLTLVSSLFIPLTFIAGVYGMNFEYMPELTWHFGYFLILGIMASVAAGIVLLLRKWF